MQLDIWSVWVTPTDQNIIMYQLKPLKQYIYYRNQQLDGMNNVDDNTNVFSITSRFVLKHKIYHRIQIVFI